MSNNMRRNTRKNKRKDDDDDNLVPQEKLPKELRDHNVRPNKRADDETEKQEKRMEKKGQCNVDDCQYNQLMPSHRCFSSFPGVTNKTKCYNVVHALCAGHDGKEFQSIHNLQNLYCSLECKERGDEAITNSTDSSAKKQTSSKSIKLSSASSKRKALSRNSGKTQTSLKSAAACSTSTKRKAQSRTSTTYKKDGEWYPSDVSDSDDDEEKFDDDLEEEDDNDSDYGSNKKRAKVEKRGRPLGSGKKNKQKKDREELMSEIKTLKESEMKICLRYCIDEPNQSARTPKWSKANGGYYEEYNSSLCSSDSQPFTFMKEIFSSKLKDKELAEFEGASFFYDPNNKSCPLDSTEIKISDNKSTTIDPISSDYELFVALVQSRNVQNNNNSDSNTKDTYLDVDDDDTDSSTDARSEKVIVLDIIVRVVDSNKMKSKFSVSAWKKNKKKGVQSIEFCVYGMVNKDPKTGSYWVKDKAIGRFTHAYSVVQGSVLKVGALFKTVQKVLINHDTAHKLKIGTKSDLFVSKDRRQRNFINLERI